MKQLLEKLIAIVKKALSNDPDDTAAHAKLEKQVAELTAEKADLQTLTGPLNELIDLATAATPEGGEPAGEPADENTVVMGFRSTGKETFIVEARNSGVSEEHASVLLGIFDAGEVGSNSVPPGGSKFDSELYYDYRDTHKIVKLDNGHQKNAADVAVLEAFLVIAKAARDASAPTA